MWLILLPVVELIEHALLPGLTRLPQMRVGETVDRLRSEMKQDPLFWQKVLSKYFVANQHRVTLHMTPDAEYNNKLEAKEAERLKAMQVRCFHHNAVKQAKVLPASGDSHLSRMFCRGFIGFLYSCMRLVERSVRIRRADVITGLAR